MSQPGSELRFGVRLRVVGRCSSQLGSVLGALITMPLCMTIAAEEYGVAWRYAGVIAALGAFGLVARQRSPVPVQANEGIVVVAGAFLGASACMVFPLAGYGLTPLDAFFEAVSGFTTTGLSVLADPESMPVGFHFARAWMQWIGGLGIVVLSLALIVEPGVTAKALAAMDAPQVDLVGGTRAYARRVLTAYIALTCAGIILLAACGSGAGNAVLYTLAAVSTGGFSPHAASVGALESRLAQCAVLLLCASGAAPLLFWRQLFQRRRPSELAVLQVVTLAVLFAVTGAALYACARFAALQSPTLGVLDAALLAVSAQSTAGFSTTAVTSLDPASKLVLMAAMAVGGGVGSTAGGVKVLRLLVLLRLCHALVLRTGMPQHAVLTPRFGEHVIGDGEARRALITVLLFGAVMVISWFPFLLSGYDPVDALFDVVSATGTVGLSSGVAGASLAPALKLVLCADMLLGRLEVLAWLVVLFPGTWFKRRRHET